MAVKGGGRGRQVRLRRDPTTGIPCALKSPNWGMPKALAMARHTAIPGFRSLVITFEMAPVVTPPCLVIST